MCVRHHSLFIFVYKIYNNSRLNLNAMKNTYQLKLKYPATFSLHHITSLMESVNGIRIQRLNVISKGCDFVGVIVVEAAGRLHYNYLVKLIRSREEVQIEE